MYTTINELYTHRPVVYHVLGHYLHSATDKIRKDQTDLFFIVQQMREGHVIEPIPLTSYHIELILLSAAALLKWIGDHPTHEWKDPTLRLVQILKGELNVPPEPRPPKEAKMTFLADGTYIIKYGCRELINGEFCEGDMVCFNWKKDQPLPGNGSPFSVRANLIYTCEKCHHTKIV